MTAWLGPLALALTTTTTASPIDEDYDCDPCTVHAAADHEPEELEWEDEGFYWMFGLSPGSTFHLTGFNPNLRYSTEVGMQWERGKARIMVGAQGYVLQHFENKRAGGGSHGMVTLGYGPAYVRSGIGVVVGVPGSIDDRDTRPALSGLIGVGLESREDDVRGRIGFDYNLSVDKAGRVNNTVFLVLQIRFG